VVSHSLARSYPSDRDKFVLRLHLLVHALAAHCLQLWQEGIGRGIANGGALVLQLYSRSGFIRKEGLL
jgi:hypothetical protein